MPPHCDSLDGPVVTAALQALDADDANLVLPYAPQSAETEIREAFLKCVSVRKLGEEAKEVADRFFFETVVRLHRAGEGAPFTGLKPAGLDHGPVIPVALQAIESGDVKPLVKILCDKTEREVKARFGHMKKLEEHKGEGVDPARNYVSATLGLQVYSHKLYHFIEEGPTQHM